MNLANWAQRVGAYLVDIAPVVVLSLIGNVVDGPSGTSGAGPIYYVFALIGFAFTIYNRWYLGGQGASLGKRVLGLRLIKEQTGQPIGMLMAFVRDICHILDSICLIGYLFPIWDAKKQTFADKILGTVVPKV